MARVRSHVIAYNAAVWLARERQAIGLKSTPLWFTDPSVAQAMPSKLVDTVMFTLEHIFLIRDFWILSSSSSFSSSSSSSLNDLAKEERDRSDIYTKHLHVLWRFASSPSNWFFLALRYRGKSWVLRLHVTERRHFHLKIYFPVVFCLVSSRYK